ncbi:hypothetical protein H5410_031657 [Solanum commersonii]|uniref:Uncharacterized protein n=1 Tax=Solanum commersonii TaxID=4109 RepID=A0A9J5YKK6_SOLCO|nr:hypothetical protein H5410_031657 [Solanum commersonii]
MRIENEIRALIDSSEFLNLFNLQIVGTSNNFVKKPKSSWLKKRSLAPDQNLKTLAVVAATLNGEEIQSFNLSTSPPNFAYYRALVYVMRLDFGSGIR